MTNIGRGSTLAVGLLLVGALAAFSPESTATQVPALGLAPDTEGAEPTLVATALQQLADGKADAALPTLTAAERGSEVGAYVRVHQGRAEMALGQLDNAALSAQAALDADGTPYLRERALWLAADAAEAAEDWPTAFAALNALTELPSTSPAQAWARLGGAARQLGRTERAIDALSRVYHDYPLSSEANAAVVDLTAMSPAFRAVTKDRAPKELARAQALYAAGRWSDARKAFEGVRSHITGDDRDLVTLRLAQLDVHQKRWAAARTALTAYIADTRRPAARRHEAQHFQLMRLRETNQHDVYVRGVRAFVDDNPTPAWAEAALNDLGTHYILTDADDKAAAIFTEQYDRHPTGPFAGRAAWKAGWWAFANGDYAETIRLFEHAAVGLRRADYRSGWVYWAAKAHERLGHHDLAIAGYDQTIADYGNSYYGREAADARETLLAARRPTGAGPVAPVRRDAPLTFEPGEAPSTAATIQSLLAAQLWDDAIGEIRRAQRLEGATPLLDATLAYAYNRKGELRLAISAMKRAYPRYLADGSDVLPRDIRTVLFPLEYWDLIQQHADQHDLDPFVIAALMAQESTFDAGIRSAANAWGLMQILPSTGSRYARSLGIRPFNTASLTRPEVNVRIGTQYFADLVRRYNGDIAPALAAYNAGENRVDRWVKERPGVDRDEFVDGIPFPETQGYVKKILGTAEDYRVLYRRTGGRR